MSKSPTARDELVEHITTAITIKSREIPLYICCPITLEIMKEPVVAIDGYSYEKSTITAWFKENSKLPITGIDVTNKTLYANNALKIFIADWLIKNPQPVPSMMDENPPQIKKKPQPQSPRNNNGLFSGNRRIVSQSLSLFVNVTMIEFTRAAHTILNRENSLGTPRQIVPILDV
jgi:hypothetical protein